MQLHLGCKGGWFCGTREAQHENTLYSKALRGWEAKKENKIR